MSRRGFAWGALLTVFVAVGMPWRGATAAPAEQEQPEEDPVALAALLIADQNFDRAAAVLAEVDPTAKGIDTVRYWTLAGLLLLESEDAPAAVIALDKAREASEDAPDPMLMMTLARARVLSGNPQGALLALDEAGEELDGLASSWTLRARAWRDLGDEAGAWAAMEEGLARFPEHKSLQRQQVMLLIESGLTRAAGEQAQRLLSRADTTEEDILVVAEALRVAGIHDQAVEVLEGALLQNPASLELRVRLAVVHLDAGRPFAAARLFEQAAALDPSYTANAASLYLAAGRPGLALHINAQVLDAKEKVTQRFTIFAKMADWERAAALDARLSRLGVLDDESLRYGLAYAHFETGDHARAEDLLSGIEDARLFRQATSLREAIDKCRERPEQCG